jgi:phenylalanyl-tRNA synthetase beta chain
VLRLAINIIVTALAEMGGTIESMEVVGKESYTTPDLYPWKMDLAIADVHTVLGTEFSSEEIADRLERMGYGIASANTKRLTVLVPAYRADILHPVDLIEDVAIAHGYDTFSPQIPQTSTIGAESRKDIVTRKIIEILAGYGILETNSFVLASSESQTEKVLRDIGLVTLKNPSTKEYDCVREWLVSSLLDTLQLNNRHEHPQRICTAGRCAQLKGKGFEEYEHIAAALAGEDVTFTSIKQALDHLFAQVGIASTIKEVDHPTFIPGRVGEIMVGKKSIGVIGEIHPQVLENFQMEYPVSVFELDADRLTDLID